MTLNVPAGRLTVLRAAAMFDGVSSALVSGPSVVIADGVIAAVHGPAGPLPAGAHVVDLPGLTLIPGLVDTHLHLCSDILAIDGNPLADPAAIRRLRAVYADARAILPAPGRQARIEVP